jgi:hypothetical protein
MSLAFTKTRLLLLTTLVAIAVAACGPPQGRRVRFIKATTAELSAAEQEHVVWYEFQPGDEVPLAMVFTGVVESSTPIHATAKRNFWLVVQKNQPIQFSFDGEHVVNQNAGQVALALGQHQGANHVGVLVYLGRPEDTPAELKKQ